MHPSFEQCDEREQMPKVNEGIRQIDGRRVIYGTYRGDIRTIDGKVYQTFGLKEAIERANRPGDIVQFLPNKYWSPYKPCHYGDAITEPEPIVIAGRRGTPENPITIRGMGAQTIFCGHNAAVPIYPDLPERRHFAFFKIIDCEWLEFENMKVESCWPTFSFIENSRYISFRKIEAIDSVYLVFARGLKSHHLLLEDNIWVQDPSGALWKDLFWDEVHGYGKDQGKYRYLNGGLFGCKGITGSVVFRRNVIQDAYNGIRMVADPDMDVSLQNLNVEIYENLFDKLRDNAFEPEKNAVNWYIRHNSICNNHAPFSFDGVGGGYWLIFGNLGWFNEKPGQDVDPNTQGKWFKFLDGPPYPHLNVSVFNNSWFLRVPVIKKGLTANFRHFNNAVEFCNPDDFGDCVCKPGRSLVSRKFMDGKWDDSVVFDYDLDNRPISKILVDNNQEKHGVYQEDFHFEDARAGELEFPRDYDPPAGERVVLESGRDWAGDYDWKSNPEDQYPVRGAYQDDGLLPGPPFFFYKPENRPEGYMERPRIVSVERNVNAGLIIHFSTLLAEADVRVYLQAPGRPDSRIAAPARTEGSRLIIEIPAGIVPPSLDDAEITLPQTLVSVEGGLPVTLWANVDPKISF